MNEYKTELKIYSSPVDWYIARNPEHAAELEQQHTGKSLTELEDWALRDPDEQLGITFEHILDAVCSGLICPPTCDYEIGGDYPNQHITFTAPCSQWALYGVAGFLCSSEY